MSTDRHALVYVGIGSNLDPARHVRDALRAMAARRLLHSTSPTYWSDPVGIPGAPPFLNLVVGLRWSGNIDALKTDLDAIERAHGRTQRGWCSRTLDADILLTASPRQQTYRGGTKRVPHPDIGRYAHVAVPLADLVGDRPHPDTGEGIAAIAARLNHDGLRLAQGIVATGHPLDRTVLEGTGTTS